MVDEGKVIKRFVRHDSCGHKNIASISKVICLADAKPGLNEVITFLNTYKTSVLINDTTTWNPFSMLANIWRIISTHIKWITVSLELKMKLKGCMRVNLESRLDNMSTFSDAMRSSKLYVKQYQNLTSFILQSIPILQFCWSSQLCYTRTKQLISSDLQFHHQIMWPRVIPWVTWLTSYFQPLSDEVLLVQDENSK